ncbi:hypothetical protein KI387_005816, partial [Taxus chinensis]
MQENRLSLVSRGLGQPGKKYAGDVNQPIFQKTVHFGWFGDIFPRQSGIVGIKVRKGRVE